MRKHDNAPEGRHIALYFAMVLALGMGLGVLIERGETHREAIERGAAYYDAKTGAFTWMPPPTAQPRMKAKP